MQNTLKEARHFLGIKDGVTDAELDNKILDTLKEISEKFPARQYYRLFDLKKHSVGFELSGTGLILEGDTAEKMLCDCQKIAVFAVLRIRTPKSQRVKTGVRVGCVDRDGFASGCGAEV